MQRIIRFDALIERVPVRRPLWTFGLLVGGVLVGMGVVTDSDNAASNIQARGLQPTDFEGRPRADSASAPQAHAPTRLLAIPGNTPSTEDEIVSSGVRIAILDEPSLWKQKYAGLSSRELIETRLALTERLEAEVDTAAIPLFRHRRNLLSIGEFPINGRHGIAVYARRVHPTTQQLEIVSLSEAEHPELFAMKRECRWLRHQERRARNQFLAKAREERLARSQAAKEANSLLPPIID